MTVFALMAWSCVTAQLVSTGDVTLAWQAADALSYLATPAHVGQLLDHGAVEEVTQLLQVRGGRVERAGATRRGGEAQWRR